MEGGNGWIEGRQVTHHHFVDVRFTAYNKNPDNNTEPRHKAAALLRGLGMPSVVCILVVCMKTNVGETTAWWFVRNGGVARLW